MSEQLCHQPIDVAPNVKLPSTLQPFSVNKLMLAREMRLNTRSKRPTQVHLFSTILAQDQAEKKMMKDCRLSKYHSTVIKLNAHVQSKVKQKIHIQYELHFLSTKRD